MTNGDNTICCLFLNWKNEIPPYFDSEEGKKRVCDPYVIVP